MKPTFQLLLSACLLAACTPSKPAAPETEAARAQKKGPAATHAEAPAHASEHTHEELPRLVRLTPEVIEKAGVRTATAAREQLPATVGLPGEVVADPDHSAEISAPIAGRLEQVQFREGSVVKRGDVLALLRVHDLGQLRSTYSATLAKAKAARANAQRLEGLSAQRLASEQAYLDALAQAEALDVEANAAHEQLTALGTTAGKGPPSTLALRAPVDGTVVMRDAVIGQPVSAEHTIGRIVDLSRVWFLARVFEKDVSKVRIGAGAEVQLNAYPEQRFEGRIEYVGRQVDPNARTLTARIALENRDDLLSVGLFGTAYVSLAHETSSESVLVVPRTALTDIAGKQVVFVRHADQSYEVHEVVVGASAGGKVQIISGLHEGEQTVVAGVFTLKSVVLKSTFAEEE